MILPGSQLFNLIFLILGMFCWGIWANTFRMTSKWRFELYCFDFAIGAGLAALIIGLTFGSLGWDGFSLIDDLRLAGKKQDVLAMGAGLVFNLGNMLILGALSVAGVTIAYLIGVGLMLTAGTVFMYFTAPSGNPTMILVGAIMIVGAAAFLAISSRQHSMARLVVLMREGKTKSTKKVISIKGFALAGIGGIVAGACFPLIYMAKDGENGLGPYSLGFFFATGIFVSTLIFNLFFMNLPVQGEPVEIRAYFRGKGKSHALGLVGGALWYIGLQSFLIQARAEGKGIVPAQNIRALMFAAVILGCAAGLFRWKEFEGAEGRVRTFLGVALLLFVAGMVMLSLAARVAVAG